MAIIGCDVGGTYTDMVAFDADAGDLRVGKVPSTPRDQSIGLMDGLESVDAPPSEISMLLHGTTVATNAVLERAGAPCGLLTTDGFRDVLELGWRDRPNLWGLGGEYTPVVPRDRCIGIEERTAADGSIVDPVSEADVRDAARRLHEAGAEAVAVTFLHSYANPRNEERAVDVLDEEWPNDHVVRSSAVLPEFREFERASTTALTAYTRPVVSSYLDRLATRLEDGGFDDEVLLMQSNGGLASASVSKRRSAHTILSGPAAGATAASYIANAIGYENVISCDMGGTSFDVALLPDGDPIMTQSTELDYQVPIRVPMTDITTIGAGGGSIAWIDEGGILQTGPESAGADPGPVCYGKGGTDVTITDAHLVLERINPANPIGEDLALDLDAAREAIGDGIAAELGCSIEEAANAIVDVGVNKMVGELRRLSIGQGYDPREFTLVTFGGAGPLHAGELIQQSDVPRAVVPYYPGVLSALGCVLADARHDQVRTVNETIDDLDLETVHETIADLERRGRSLLADHDGEFEAVDLQYRSDMKYSGQAHTVTVPFESATPTKADLREHFHDVYLETYTEAVEKPVLVDNVRVSAIGVSQSVDLQRFIDDAGDSLATAVIDEREVHFGDGWTECPIYDRERIPIGATFTGPAVIEQPDTTTVVNPDLECTIDEYGNAILEVAS